jgi:metal-responsive CopG/Arc/MetJ family transcriptional regulator
MTWFLARCETLVTSIFALETDELDTDSNRGNTIGMKVAVSIPDKIFEQADHLTSHMKTSRSHLYSRALEEFVARHAPDSITEAMDRVCEKLYPEQNDFGRRAARRVLEKSEW